MLKSLLSLLLTTTIFAAEFESVNYYTKNYLFDAQIYSVNTFVSENTLSHQLGDFTPHLDYVQYQGLDKYKESDFGLGSEYKLTDKLTLDAISKKAGFVSRSTFISSFKLRTGLTPSEFIETLS